MYIYTELQRKIEKHFRENKPSGLVLSGIVGCGMTTMIEKLLEEWGDKYETFSFTGDSSQFRNDIRQDSEYLYKYISSRTTKSALIFVDEIQKCEEVFDAIKIAFDRGKISFIISGSNPAYLATVARKLLQRRADFLVMSPISLRELINHKSFLPKQELFVFEKFLWNDGNPLNF